jgi:hypothetical protein
MCASACRHTAGVIDARRVAGACATLPAGQCCYVQWVVVYMCAHASLVGLSTSVAVNLMEYCMSCQLGVVYETQAVRVQPARTRCVCFTGEIRPYDTCALLSSSPTHHRELPPPPPAFVPAVTSLRYHAESIAEDTSVATAYQSLQPFAAQSNGLQSRCISPNALVPMRQPSCSAPATTTQYPDSCTAAPHATCTPTLQ